jgi:hypothetical protein
MIDFIIIAILVVIAAALVFFLVRQKKQGVTCIGCPHGKQCGKAKGKSCSCGCCGVGAHHNCSDNHRQNEKNN